MSNAIALSLLCLPLAIIGEYVAAKETATVSLPGVVVSRTPLNRGTRTKICHAPGNAPFVAVSGYVWDVRKGQKVSDVTVPLGVDVGELVVSPDGKHLAYSIGAGGSGALKTIHVLSCQTGEMVCECTTGADTRIGFLQFAGPTQVVCCVGRKAVVCDIPQKRIILEFPIHTYAMRDTTAATSHKGRYLAVSDDEEILVYDLPTGKPVAKMEEPQSERGALVSVDALTFSPDSQELAAIVDRRIVVWSNTGKIRSEHKLPAYDRNSIQRSLSWLLDRSGWLIDGSLLLDRSTGRPLWILRSPNRVDRQQARLLDQNHVLLMLEHSRDHAELITTNIPWSRIREAGAGNEAGEVIPIETRLGE